MDAYKKYVGVLYRLSVILAYTMGVISVGRYHVLCDSIEITHTQQCCMSECENNGAFSRVIVRNDSIIQDDDHHIISYNVIQFLLVNTPHYGDDEKWIILHAISAISSAENVEKVVVELSTSNLPESQWIFIACGMQKLGFCIYILSRPSIAMKIKKRKTLRQENWIYII